MRKFSGIFILILTALVLLIACANIIILEQSSFSAGADVVKNLTDEDFTQAATGAEGTGVTTYSSSDTAVATVNSSSGLVHIVSIGTTTITSENPGDSTYEAVSDSYLLTVKDPHFITTYLTLPQTTTDNESITIPTYSGATYNYNVDWGDGTTDTAITGNGTHIYTTAGIYTVKISGYFPRIYFFNHYHKDKILTIENWGAISWTSMAFAFQGCSNLTYTAKDNPDLSLVRGMKYMFFDASLFNGNIGSWDVSSVTNMGSMFYYTSAFTNHDLSAWNVENVTNHYNFSTGWGSGNTEPNWP